MNKLLSLHILIVATVVFLLTSCTPRYIIPIREQQPRQTYEEYVREREMHNAMAMVVGTNDEVIIVDFITWQRNQRRDDR